MPVDDPGLPWTLVPLDELPVAARPPERGLGDAGPLAAGPAARSAGHDGTAGDPEGAFQGQAGFEDAVRALIEQAAAQGAHQLSWCDPDFLAWPLGSAEVVVALTRWAVGPGERQLLMVCASAERLFIRHPRFARWQADFAHRVRVLCPEESLRADLPTLWADSFGQVLQVFDRDRQRGRTGATRQERQRVQERIDALAQRAEPSVSNTILGL